VPITVEGLRRIMPLLPQDKAHLYLPHLEVAMREFDIITSLRMAGFLAQMAHESGQLSRWTENLNYSAEGLRRTWPTRFKTDRTAQKYARKPEAIANYVYADRYGNGNEASGDGWRFRGRGPGQLTFRSNYRTMGAALGLDLEGEPDLVATPPVGFRAFGAFWVKNGLNEIADTGDVRQMTRVINGGLLGLHEREELFARAKTVLGVRS
jgi:putative chitinase